MLGLRSTQELFPEQCDLWGCHVTFRMRNLPLHTSSSFSSSICTEHKKSICPHKLLFDLVWPIPRWQHWNTELRVSQSTAHQRRHLSFKNFSSTFSVWPRFKVWKDWDISPILEDTSPSLNHPICVQWKNAESKNSPDKCPPYWKSRLPSLRPRLWVTVKLTAIFLHVWSIKDQLKRKFLHQ